MENMQFRWVIKSDGTRYLQWRRLIAYRSNHGDTWSDWYDIKEEIKESDLEGAE